ncbi:MAG: hypothetical protein PHH09_12105, partial [Methanoregulaceae archaeon]|nr:hypothetical protein [Methanoregulaceae archaeon]
HVTAVRGSVGTGKTHLRTEAQSRKGLVHVTAVRGSVGTGKTHLRTEASSREELVHVTAVRGLVGTGKNSPCVPKHHHGRDSSM